MTQRLFALALAVACLVAAGGCTVTLTAKAHLYVRPRSYVRVTSACPAPKSEEDENLERPAQPDVNAIWVSGHWTWESGWVWASGRWTVPRPGYTWEPPVCVAREGTFRFYPGYFRGQGEDPPGIYREPGHIRVHSPSDTDGDIPTRVVVRPGQTPPTNTGPGTEQAGAPDAELSGAQGGDQSTANTTVRPAAEVATQGETANTTVRPAAEVATQGETANTTVRPTAEVATQGETANTTVAPGPLQCRVRIARVPAGGYVQLQGRGFTDNVTVMISGNTAVIRRRTATAISARATRSGEVKVIRGDEQASCGEITVFR